MATNDKIPLSTVALILTGVLLVIALIFGVVLGIKFVFYGGLLMLGVIALIVIIPVTSFYGWIKTEFDDIGKNKTRHPPALDPQDMFVKPAILVMEPVSGIPWVGRLLGWFLGDLKIPVVYREPDEHIIRQEGVLQDGGITHSLEGWGIDNVFYFKSLSFLHDLPLGRGLAGIHWDGIAGIEFKIDASDQTPMEPVEPVQISPRGEVIGVMLQHTARLRSVDKARKEQDRLRITDPGEVVEPDPAELLRDARRLLTSREGTIRGNIDAAMRKALAVLSGRMTAKQIYELKQKGVADVEDGKSASQIATEVYQLELAAFGLVGEITILNVTEMASIAAVEQGIVAGTVARETTRGIADGLSGLLAPFAPLVAELAERVAAHGTPAAGTAAESPAVTESVEPAAADEPALPPTRAPKPE